MVRISLRQDLPQSVSWAYAPTENEDGEAFLGTSFPRNWSFPRGTRFRGYDGNAAVYFGLSGSLSYSSSTHAIFEGAPRRTERWSQSDPPSLTHVCK